MIMCCFQVGLFIGWDVWCY